ncbi:MAG: DsbE family thiol:disulfide interchange protein, partial [Planktomarina sp.]
MEPLAGMPTFTVADLQAADITVLNFWASWCGPCRTEHPYLETLVQDGLPVYGINYRDNPENAQAFLDELGNPFKAGGADPRGRMAVNWGVYGLPETFLIDRDGIVLYRVAGALTQRTWRDRVQPALAEQGYTLPDLR